MADLTARLQELTGWTTQDVELLIKDKTSPDHWQSNPAKPTYALIELIRDAIESSEFSYRQCFPPVFDALGLKHPPNLTGIISKVKRYVLQAEKKGNYIPLCQEAVELSHTQTDIIGPACSKLNIFQKWLSGEEVCTETITNHVIVELHQFRGKKSIPWRTVQNTWWAKLFPTSSVPAIGTIQTNWDALASKKKAASRNWTKEKRESFLASPYKLPQPGDPKDSKKAARNRKTIQKQYKQKVEGMKQQRMKEIEDRKKLQEEKERRLVSVTIQNTESVLKSCGEICKSVKDVDNLIRRKSEESNFELREALLAQIRYYKSVNRGLVKGSLFYVTSGGHALSTEELESNLKEIVQQLNTPAAEPSKSDEPSESEKELKREELRKKLLTKLETKSKSSAQKRKCPFPDDIVDKRVRHICLDPSGENLVTYKGRILRESTNKDKEELMEEIYRPYLDQGYAFYTLIYDPPYNQLYCYPLKKEWDDGLLSIM